ncbi:MAG: serine hydrolase [Cyclobacteriaceae bacterium]|nr:serine hydrolase [Cyclobacteriaceae bacterium]
MSNCSQKPHDLIALELELKQVIAKTDGTIAISVYAPSTEPLYVGINDNKVFHAASTMKVPVMCELFRRAATGEYSMDDSLEVSNSFQSIFDGSSYTLERERDSDQEIYDLIGTRQTLRWLNHRMIVKSSNLATNIIIDQVLGGGNAIRQNLAEHGILDSKVLRGVEDMKAWEAGLNNTTTAAAYTAIFQLIMENETFSEEQRQEMIDILLGQEHKTMLPARLPENVKMAHKTGSIEKHRHDGGIVFLTDEQWYIITILSSDLEDEKAGEGTIAELSHAVYLYFTQLYKL